MSPTIFRAIAISRGLKFYHKTGMKPNTLWTPRAMMKAASQITGRTFRPRDYLGAAAAIDKLLEENRQ